MPGRYAPSPTGPLHLGNLRTALVAWLYARLEGDEILLRFDDLDIPRNRQGAVENIESDLRWLGLEFDGDPYLQSTHLENYDLAFQKLKDNGLVYPCQCSRKDIQLAPSAPDRRFAEGRYAGTCRPENGHPASLESALAWRFSVADEVIRMQDSLAGSVEENLFYETGDFIVKRKDNIFAYQLATVVDDGLMNITSVVRGADLLSSTVRQLALYHALKIEPPRFSHVPLMVDGNGDKLSKRDHAESLAVLQHQGKSAESIVGMLAASLGLIDNDQKISTQDLLASISAEQLIQRLRSRA